MGLALPGNPHTDGVVAMAGCHGYSICLPSTRSSVQIQSPTPVRSVRCCCSGVTHLAPLCATSEGALWVPERPDPDPAERVPRLPLISSVLSVSVVKAKAQNPGGLHPRGPGQATAGLPSWQSGASAAHSSSASRGQQELPLLPWTGPRHGWREASCCPFRREKGSEPQKKGGFTLMVDDQHGCRGPNLSKGHASGFILMPA